MSDQRFIREIESSGLFDPDWYSQRYQDAAQSQLSPIAHFSWLGLRLNRSPGPAFDTAYYTKANPDIHASGLHPLQHYIRYGRAEGRPGIAVNGQDPAAAASTDTGSPHFLATMPANADWTFRLATDAFMHRGLRPCADYAVVINAATPADWQAACTVLENLTLPHDVFLLGSNQFDFSAMPPPMVSLAYLGAADDTGNARGFVRFVHSGALSDYKAVLWLSPSDGALATPDAAQIEAFSADSDCGVQGSQLEQWSRNIDSPLTTAMKIALPRLGLTVPQQDTPYASGATLLIKPLLLRALGQILHPAQMTADGANGSFPGRASVQAALGLLADQARLQVRGLAAGRPAAAPAQVAKREVKAVAFYLPQFHPIPENDQWWGKGFTEWSNVTRGKPLFRHHNQPRVPADLGYYDLRLEDTQAAQADLARDFGIHGFCYYYYWFNGKKLLNQPIEQMARSSRTDAGFCVCWANENWSRNWDGQNRHVLMKQDYSLESNRALILEMIPMMKDPRWIRHQGKPVMVVYRISIIPNWLETARIWREECRKAGLGEIHLCAVRFGLEMLDGQPQVHGLDAYVLFPPHEAPREDLRDTVLDLHKDFGGEIFSYEAVVKGDTEKYAQGYDWPVHRGAMLGWDNTARRLTDARIFHGATPYGFRTWIKSILEQENQFNPAPESLLFINAWNEWAEGTYLEPDQRWGHGYLEAFASAAKSVPGIALKETAKGTAKQPHHGEVLRAYGSPLDQHGAALNHPRWHSGQKTHNPDWPTVLLCAHVAGHQLFGGERSLLDVLRAMAKLPLNIVVTLPSDNNPDYVKDICAESLGTYAFAYPQWRDARQAYGWLTLNFADILTRHGIGLVYANTIMLLEPLAAAQRLGRQRLIHSRELISLDDKLRDRIDVPTSQIISQVLQRSDWIVGNSQATCSMFHRQGRTLYVPNAVSPEDFDMGNKFGNAIKFGIVSSNIPAKGVGDFVEVARRAAAQAPRAKFVVIGPDNDQTRGWAAEVERGERPDNLVFAGYRDTPRAAMSEINVLLNLSGFAESFGRTVAEGLAARRPVIAYEWGALDELIQHRETGYLIPYRDIDGVVAAVAEICATSDLIPQMGEKGRAFICDNFSQSSIRAALKQGFDTIIADTPLSTTPLMPIAPAPRTTVVIPIYNAAKEARDCIKSVLRHTDLSHTRVLIINDGSPEPDVVPMLAEFEGILGLTIQHNDPNIGYTKTINRGIREAGNDDVVLLNSDTIVTPKWLEGLRATAYSRDKIATVTAMSDNAGAFSFPTFNAHCPKPDHLSLDEYAILMVEAGFDCPPPEVPTGSGFCMFIRRALIEECGLFDEEGFPRGYGEENDFCMRAMKAGWVNLISPWSFVYHERTASFKGEKTKLVQAGVDVVTKRYPDYAGLVKEAFEAPEMRALRMAVATALNTSPETPL